MDIIIFRVTRLSSFRCLTSNASVAHQVKESEWKNEEEEVVWAPVDRAGGGDRWWGGESGSVFCWIVPSAFSLKLKFLSKNGRLKICRRLFAIVVVVVSGRSGGRRESD